MQMSMWEILEARGSSCPQQAEGQHAWLLWGNIPVNKEPPPGQRYRCSLDPALGKKKPKPRIL